MTTKPSNNSGSRKPGSTGTKRSGSDGRKGPRDARATRTKSVELDGLVTTLPRRISYLSRVLYRTRGSSLPRGMRSVVFTLAFGPLSVSEVASEEGIGQPAATRVVARLEALGLVSRERSDTDRRIVMVSLTERGRAELDILREQSRTLLRQALRDRPMSELRRLGAASEALALLTEWMLEEERAAATGNSRAQPTSAGSRRRTRRALRS